MESSTESLPINYATPKFPSWSSNDFYLKGRKWMRTVGEGEENSNVAFQYTRDESEQKKPRTASKVFDYSDPFAIPGLLEGLDGGKFGSATKDIEDLLERRMQTLKPLFATYPSLPYTCLDAEKRSCKEASKLSQLATPSAHKDVIVLEDDRVTTDFRAIGLPLVVLDSDDEENGDQKSILPNQEVSVRKTPGEFLMKDFFDKYCGKPQNLKEEDVGVAIKTEVQKDKGVYLGVEDDMATEEGDQQSDVDYGLDDIWKEMTFALECSKDTAGDLSADEHGKDDGENCDHSFVLKDDIGYVCRICGVIQKGIESIIEYQYPKSTRTTRTYMYESRNSKDREAQEIHFDGVKLSDDFTVTEIFAHPRHSKQMKPHQIEGFNFLLRNLVSDNPGGCILAHAPGSGKTFMIISFMQSFLAKYPHARPLVVLPKGILSTWKKEFERWQVEDIPLYDFYTVKADNRTQQLEVLKQWTQQKSILFLGYKQFSTIVSDDDTSKVASACQEILLTYPSILILDEGHTPRNEETDVLNCLKKVQTPRKVVLSGTLYQNHVKEVFNILDLVRPKFLNLDTSRAIRRRIQSRIPISGARKHLNKNKENVFYELVEHALQKDQNFKRKTTVIQDLREMTSKVLHYYKGDFLDELPGLLDFTVFLNLFPGQKREVGQLWKLVRKFKISSEGSAIYVHPQLKYLSRNSASKDRVDDEQIDDMLEKIDIKEGVKAKFFLNLLNLCESAGEKLLVFSQYLPPLKFLERLAMKSKGWSPRKEIFVITGDTSSEDREQAMELFNNSSDARVLFGSIKACGEGISLVGASRVLILDVHLNPSVTRQAIGRAFRPGQVKKVYTYRLVAAESPEEEDHSTCFRKESIAKMWFEWNEYCGHNDFEIESVDVKNCGDQFLETPWFSEDIKALYRR